LFRGTKSILPTAGDGYTKGTIGGYHKTSNYWETPKSNPGYSL
jgi:hypothetical protein